MTPNGKRPVPDVSSADVKAISRRATSGSRDAMKSLIEAGQLLQQHGRYAEASEVLLDAARCFRIDSFRARTCAEEAESKINELSNRLSLIESWSLRNRDVLRPRPQSRPDLSESDFMSLIERTLSSKNDFCIVADRLIDQFWAQGYQFSSPGNSPRRVLFQILLSAFSYRELNHGSTKILCRPETRLLYDELVDMTMQELLGRAQLTEFSCERPSN